MLISHDVMKVTSFQLQGTQNKIHYNWITRGMVRSKEVFFFNIIKFDQNKTEHCFHLVCLFSSIYNTDVYVQKYGNHRLLNSSQLIYLITFSFDFHHIDSLQHSNTDQSIALSTPSEHLLLTLPEVIKVITIIKVIIIIKVLGRGYWSRQSFNTCF